MSDEDGESIGFFLLLVIRLRIVERFFAYHFRPIFDLVPIEFRICFHPACPAGNPGVGSPAVQLRPFAAEDTNQLRHPNGSFTVMALFVNPGASPASRRFHEKRSHHLLLVAA